MSKKKNQVYNISSNESSSIKEIINKISKILNRKLNIKEKNGTLGDPLHNLANINKIQKVLKYKFKYHLDMGLINTIKNIKI